MMGKIVYGVCGEGLGHATRVMTSVNQLRLQHRILIFAARDAYRYLTQHVTQNESLLIEEIPGLHFRYLFKKISYPRTLLSSIPYLLNMGKQIRQMEHRVKDFGCDLVISDFEPLTARFARKIGVPLVSVDHQNFIRCLDFDSLPTGMRWKSRLTSWFVGLHYHWQDKTVVSSFFNSCFESSNEVQHVGVSVRKDIMRRKPQLGPNLLVYLRKFPAHRLLKLLSQSQLPAVVYGRHEHRTVGNLEFKPINNESFCEDLASCKALICNAGNQLVGEALSLQKPVLAIPEPGNIEQQLNGYFLDRMGVGQAVPSHQLSKETLYSFLEQLDHYRELIRPGSIVGNEQILRSIHPYLKPEPLRTSLVEATTHTA